MGTGEGDGKPAPVILYRCDTDGTLWTSDVWDPRHAVDVDVVVAVVVDVHDCGQARFA